MTKAKTAPKREDVEKTTPVRIEPISLKAKKNNKIENAMLKAPTEKMYGIEIQGISKLTQQTRKLLRGLLHR